MKFERSRLMEYLCVINAVLYMAVGIVNALRGMLGLAAAWIVCAGLWGWNAAWRARRPYIEINSTELIVYPAPARKPRVIQRSMVTEIDNSRPRSMRIFYGPKQPLVIPLFEVRKDQRDALREALAAFIAGKDSPDE